MNEDPQRDTVLDSLKALSTTDVDHARSQRIRERCHRELRGSRWSRAVAKLPSLPAIAAVLEPAVFAVACLAFLSEIARRAILLLTQLPR